MHRNFPCTVPALLQRVQLSGSVRQHTPTEERHFGTDGRHLAPFPVCDFRVSYGKQGG